MLIVDDQGIIVALEHLMGQLEKPKHRNNRNHPQ